METVKICPQCGKPLAGGQLDGICPECLLRVGIGTHPPKAKAGSGGGATFVPPTPEELAADFPNLEILELLGKGGMGAVYKARQPSLDRLVALKILPPEVGGDKAFAERFSREAKALARLNHPNIITVHEFGQTAAGQFFFIMEFIDGMTLRQVLLAQRLSPREAMEIVPRICEALQYAHDEGVVHRDIKPENILVDKKGRVKIADFGLAKLVGGAAEAPLTRSAEVMGTPQYMAPEQFEHPQEVDHRADIYSLGVVFYEMLTGELPLGRFAPPSRKVQVDVRLDEVVLRALEKEPELRYQQASQFKTQVETINVYPLPDAQPAPPLLKPANLGTPPIIPAEPKPAAVSALIQAPAIALLVVGGLNILAISLMTIFGSAFLHPFVGFHFNLPHGILGAKNFSLGDFVPFLLGGMFWITLAASGFMIAGALCMRRLEHHGLAVLGAILSIVFSGTSILGIAVGIWALIVLSRKDVKKAFKAARLPTAAGPLLAPGPGSPQLKKSQAWIFALVAALLFIVLVTVPLLLFGLAYLRVSTRINAADSPRMEILKGQPQPAPVALERPAPMRAASLNQSLLDFSVTILRNQGPRFSYGSIAIDINPQETAAEITLNELTDTKAAAGEKIEGGFTATKTSERQWDFRGWGRLADVKAILQINP